MAYILTDGKNYIARSYMGRYMARDYLMSLQHVFGGRITASAALTFDRKEEAERYLKINSDSDLVSNNMTIRKYNVCCNCLE